MLYASFSASKGGFVNFISPYINQAQIQNLEIMPTGQ